MRASPSDMFPLVLARWAGILGWLAMGSLASWGIGLLLGWDAIAPVGTLGAFGDVLLTLECLLALPVLVELHRRFLRIVGKASLFLLPVGTLGLTLLALVQTMHLADLIGLTREAPIAFLAMLLIALWLAFSGLIGVHVNLFTRRLVWVGLIACAGVLTLVGCAGLLATDPATRTLSGQALKAHTGLVLGAAIGLLVWGIAFAVWLWWIASEPAKDNLRLENNETRY